MAHPILIDSDPGIDDALAILLALASRELELIGVTTVFGNSADVNLLTRNALAILELGGRDDIPVAAGAAHPLVSAEPPLNRGVHGEDALGGVGLPAPQRAPERAHAAQFIAETCRARPGVTLVAIGPLTNLALALQLDPALPQRVARVALMGGAVDAPGTVSPVAETNIFCDPEAARLVFNAGWQVLMAGLNVTQLAMGDQAALDRLRARGNRCGEFLCAAGTRYLEAYAKGGGGLALHDAHAVMAIACPHLYQTQHVRVDVETRGDLTRGQTVADRRGVWGKPPQTDLLVGVDATAFHAEIAARVARLP